MRCIVSTAVGGSVVVTHPIPEFMAMLTHGGAPQGYFSPEVTRDGQIAKMVARGVPETTAVRWMDHLMVGGLSDAEAYELIRDRDTKREWTGKELWDRPDIPSDRWFRNAWIRSHNGGPISIHLGRAKAIQFRKVNEAIAEENNRRSEDFDAALLVADIPAIRKRIAKANDEIELRSVWF